MSATKHITRSALLATLTAGILAGCDRTLGKAVEPTRNQPQSGIPGTLSSLAANGSHSNVSAAVAAVTGLQPKISVTGPVSLSVDGIGFLTSTGTVRVQKPAGASVRVAYLASATIPSGGQLANGDVKIDGADVVWAETLVSGINGYNHLADVTSLVRSKIDAAPAGVVTFTLTELKTGATDGEILAVIFDDPSRSTNRTVALFFGAQQTTGDSFIASLSDPLDKSKPDVSLRMSLGISFGFQPAPQFSLIDVNGVRLSSCAGGQDDGQDSNGALITVGGIGDLPDNPAPNCDPNLGPRIDDELYDLLPLLANGATQIKVDTRNPSNDDNIFFAAFDLDVSGAVSSEPNNPPIIVNLRTEGSGPFSISAKSCFATYTACLRLAVDDLDPGDEPFKVSINWGDGVRRGLYTIPSKNIPLIAPHNYTAPGTYNVVVSATDRRGASSTQTIALTIAP